MQPPPRSSSRLSSLAVLALGLAVVLGCACPIGGALRGEVDRAVPVEVAPVERGSLSLRRTFHGSLEAASRIVVMTVAGGRVALLPVDLGDLVERGQIVATLDRGEYAQAVNQAAASMAMARARLSEAQVQGELAARDLERVRALHSQGAVSEAELDAALTRESQQRAAIQVAEAGIDQSRAASATARVGLEETAIVATWAGEDLVRVVAERFVDEGTIVSPNTPLLAIVDLDPLLAVTFVTERDYALLAAGQRVELRTEAWPGEVFEAEVARVAPVFDSASRQARVELSVPNPDGRLKPGLFVRAEVVLDVQDDAMIVPADALITRDGKPAVFIVADGAETASLRPVEVGVREGERVQIRGEGLSGRVVVLGQQQLADGSPVLVVP